METITSIHVWLHSPEKGRPLADENIRVRFYDKDPLKDDFLGESTVDSEGHAIVSITQSDFRSGDTPLEKYPDIYFKVMRGNEEIFKSKTLKNINLNEASDFAFTEGSHLNLGTFVVRV